MTGSNVRYVLNSPTRDVKLVGGPLAETVIKVPFGPEVYRYLIRETGVVVEYDITKDTGEFLGEVDFHH